MSHDQVARELKTVLDSLDSHDPDFTVPMLRAVLVKCHDYFNGCLKLSTLLWHMKRFRKEARIHDAKEAGE
jgi:hypothetical protein